MLQNFTHIQLRWYRSVERSLTFSVSYYRIFRTDFSQGLFMNAELCLLLSAESTFFFQKYASKKAWPIYSFIGYFWGSFYILVELLYKLLKCFEFTGSCRDSSILNEFLFLFFFVKGKHHKIIKYYNLLGTCFNQRRYCASISQNYDCFFPSIVFPTNACLIVIINIPNWSKIKNNHDIYIIKALVVVVSIPYLFQRNF